MEEQLNTFSLENYKRAVAGMIAKSNELTATSFLGYSTPRLKKYSEKEVELILESGNVSQIRTLSQHFAETNGLYQQILLHYATLLKYSGILIPQQRNKKKKVKKFEEGYNRGLHILASLHLASLMPEIAYKALTYGLYCGIVLKVANIFFLGDRFDNYGNEEVSTLNYTMFFIQLLFLLFCYLNKNVVLEEDENNALLSVW